MLHVGWDGVRRLHGSVVHIDIIDDKVWIQYDGTSQPVAEALLEAGILRDRRLYKSSRIQKWQKFPESDRRVIIH